MRLLNTYTLRMKEFAEDRPKYAILSHRWGPEEVSFKDYHKPHDETRTPAGYQKIHGLCKLARRRGLDWVWIDTCCIDKRNNSELSGSINSMFNWYQQAHECYVILHDFPPNVTGDLAKCDWFTRGWTLQELLAPHSAIFCASDWTFIGYKGLFRIRTMGGVRHTSHDVPSLHSQLSTITGIRECYFESLNIHLPRASIAGRMSWVSRRRTTRIEDMAYSMLGIFKINIPLLYGEGPRAFQRLQQEIIKVSNDTSIFAWDVSAFSQTPTWTKSTGWSDTVIKTSFSSVLVPHPSYFQGSADVTSDRLKSTKLYAFSNEGFQFCSESFSCCLDELEFGEPRELFVIDLGCAHSSHVSDQKKPIYLVVALRVDKPLDCGPRTFQRAWMEPKSLPQRAYWSRRKRKQFCVQQS